MKPEPLLIFVFTFVLLSVVAQASIENSRYINKLTEYFDEDVLAGTIKNIDDLEDAAKGTEKVLGSVKVFENVVPGIGDVGKLDFLKNVAKLSDEAAEDVSKIADVKGIDKLTNKILSDATGGFAFEAKIAKGLREQGEELLELSRKIDGGEVDVVSKKGGQMIASEVKSGKIEMEPKLADQLDRLSNYVKSGNANKARLVSKQTVPENVKSYALERGIEIVEGGV